MHSVEFSHHLARWNQPLHPSRSIPLKVHRLRREFRLGSPYVSSGKVLRRLARRGVAAPEQKVKSLVGSLLLRECRMQRGPSFIARKSIRLYGKSRSDTRTCPQWVRAPMAPCGKLLFALLDVLVAKTPNLTSIHFRRGLLGCGC